MAKLKIGIVGCGGIANQKHFPSLTANADLCELVAFCDIIEERAIQAAKEFGVPDSKVFTDYKELLKDGGIDVVHVLTPNVAHAPIAIASLEAGKHVMCEKPMSHTYADAQKMIAAWQKSGKKFTIGYQNRFRKEVASLHASCENGELGDIYFAKAHAIRRKAVPTWGVFPDKSLQGGGPLIDIGTHALDITLWMMDNYKPLSVSGSVFCKLGGLEEAAQGNLFGPWDHKTYEVEDSAFGLIKMENGASIFLESAWALNVLESKEASTTLCGTKAGAQINSGMSFPDNELIYNSAKNGILMEERMTRLGSIAYFTGGGASAEGKAEAKQWLTAIIEDSEPLVKPNQALIVTQILEGIYKSNDDGKEVFFN